MNAHSPTFAAITAQPRPPVSFTGNLLTLHSEIERLCCDFSMPDDVTDALSAALNIVADAIIEAPVTESRDIANKLRFVATLLDSHETYDPDEIGMIDRAAEELMAFRAAEWLHHCGTPHPVYGVPVRPSAIADLFARRNAITVATQGLPDDLRDKIADEAWKLEMAILDQPAASADDLEIKLRLWDELFEDPASILDEHRPLWEQLKADFRRVAQ